MSKGLLENKEVRRAAIDIDISINDLERLKNIFEQKRIVEKLNEINEIIFKVFKKMLSKQFLNTLTKTASTDEKFIGVNNNE